MESYECFIECSHNAHYYSSELVRSKKILTLGSQLFLLRCNWHTAKCIYLTVPFDTFWHIYIHIYIYIHICIYMKPSLQSREWTHPLPQKVSSCPLMIPSSHSTPPQPWQALIDRLFATRDYSAFSIVFYKCNPPVCLLSHSFSLRKWGWWGASLFHSA